MYQKEIFIFIITILIKYINDELFLIDGYKEIINKWEIPVVFNEFKFFRS